MIIKNLRIHITEMMNSFFLLEFYRCMQSEAKKFKFCFFIDKLYTANVFLIK